LYRYAESSPEGAAYATVRGVLLNAFGKTRAPSLLAAVVTVIADDADGGADAAAVALSQQQQQQPPPPQQQQPLMRGGATIIPGGEYAWGQGRGDGDPWPDGVLAEAAWRFAADPANAPSERVTAGTAVFASLIADAPPDTVGLYKSNAVDA
jgi:hypothetical protein